MYIDGNFNMFNYLDDKRIVGPIFECDEMIAPTISILNKAGFKTKFCCSGHPFTHVIRCKMEDSSIEEIEMYDIACYIAFDMDKETRKRFTPPEGFNVEEDELVDGESTIVIRKYYENTGDGDKLFPEILDTMKELHAWAVALMAKERASVLNCLDRLTSMNDNVDSMEEIRSLIDGSSK